MAGQIRDEAKRRASNERWQRLRLLGIAFLILAIFMAIAWRVHTLQAEETHLQTRAERQSTGQMTLGAGGENELDGHRGYIYDRHGYELAISVETPSIFVHPKQIEDREEAALQLSRALDMDISELRQKLMSNSNFVWIARKLSPDKGARAKAIQMRGMGSKRESKRYYPGQELAGQILGFVGLDNVGLEGIESAYDKYLRGSVMRIKGVRDARGRIILTTDSPRLNELEGGSIVLTLDQYIQKATENALERTASFYNAKAAVAVVLDVKTGEVLAMANWPRFNPNRFKDYPKDDMRNRAVLDAYEPGSLMKVFTYAAAIDSGKAQPDDTISQERNKLKIGGHTISDTHTIPNLTAERAVIESSNIGAYSLAQRVGREGFYNYLLAFGFGQRSGINIAGESAGILWKPNRWAEIMFANIAFGHGISTSPIQLASAVAAIGNDGMLMQPWLVREIRDHDGKLLFEGKAIEKRQVVKAKSAKIVRQAMERVTTEGTGMRAWVGGYRVGGKTGTAQKVDPKTRSYGNRYMANFMGLAPIDKPNIAVIVLVDEPKQKHSGGIVAAPVFAEIVTQVLPYRGVYPENVLDGSLNPFEMMRLQIPSTAETLPFHEPAEPALTRLHLMREPCQDKIEVPNFKGLSSLAALELATEHCLELELRQTGYVVTQWPTAGSSAAPHSRVELSLEGRYKALK